MWSTGNRLASVDRLNKIEMPTLAQVCRLMRPECFGVYYNVTKFILVFSCRNRETERDSLISFANVAKILSRRIQLLRPRGLEIRFVGGLKLHCAALKWLTIFFATLHANWLYFEYESSKIKLDFSVGGPNTVAASHFEYLVAGLFWTGVKLSMMPCECKDQPIKSPTWKGRRMMMLECDRDVRY
jgi:hypothetical protein